MPDVIIHCTKLRKTITYNYAIYKISRQQVVVWRIQMKIADKRKPSPWVKLLSKPNPAEVFIEQDIRLPLDWVTADRQYAAKTLRMTRRSMRKMLLDYYTANQPR